MIQRNLKITIYATIFLIALGAYTTASGSGMGCADVYPLCDSGWLPNFDNPEQVTEWLHRLGAAIVGLCAFFAFFKSFKTPFRKIAMTSCLILLFQGALGAFTVKTELQEPWLIFAHLFTSMLFLGSLAAWYTATENLEVNENTSAFTRISKICCIFTMLQIAIGAMHVHLFKGSAHVLITHIVLGFLVTGFSMSSMARAKRTKQDQKIIKRSSWAAYLSVLQILLGAGVFLSMAAPSYPPYITLHLMIAAIIWFMHVSNFFIKAEESI
tara:strand:+ start:530 stop:1336 length:807 start_codon:yes stop_codon:yes gene_type:complete